MDAHTRIRAVILSTIIRDMPKAFWVDVKMKSMQAYSDIFHEVAAYPAVIGEQRLDMLHQLRFFRMEHLFAAIANDHGLACSAKILAENGHGFVYATKGAIGMTQAYVPTIGSMPQPARFRERLARMNAIPRQKRLDFGDEPHEVLLGKDFYGVLAHNPIGKRFAEADQRLGMIQFCIPVQDCSGWAVELTLEDIISAYEDVAPSAMPDRSLPWKGTAGKKREQE